MADASNALVRLRLLGAAQFKRDAKAADRSLSDLGDTATHVGGALGRLGAVGAAAAAGGLLASIKASSDFEQKMANVQGKLLTSTANMKVLSNQALKLGADTSFSASQVADAMNELAAQGFSTKQIMETIPGTLSLAAASGADLAQSAAIQTETLHAFGFAAKNAGMVADVLAQVSNRTAADIDDLQESLKYIAPVAKATGQSLNDVGAAIGLMANVGIKGSQAGTTLRTALVRLSAPTPKATTALSKLGIATKDLTGPKGLKPLPKILAMFAKGSEGVSKNTRNAAIAAIFGREALSGMVALIEKGPKKLNKLSDALEHSRGAAKRAADIQRNTVKGAFDQLTGSVETAAIKLTQRFNPALRGAFKGAAGQISKLTTLADGFQSGFLGEGTSKKPKRASSRMEGMGNRARPADVPQSASAMFGAQARKTAEDALSFIQGTVIPAVQKGAKDFIAALKPAQPFLENVLLPAIEGFGAGILSGVKGAYGLFKAIMPVLGFVGKALKPLKGIIAGVGYVLGVVFGPGLVLKVVRFAEKLAFLGPVLKLVLAPLRLLRVAGVGAGRGFAIIASRVATVGRFIGKLLRPIGSAGRYIAQLSTNWRSAVGRILGFTIRLATGITSRIAGVVRSVGGFASKFFNAGKRLGTALYNGIKDLFGKGAGFALDLGKSIANSVINLLNDAIPNKIAVPGAPDIPLPDNPIPTFASGGVMQRTGMAMVGERGPELVMLQGGDRVIDAATTSRMSRQPGYATAPSRRGNQPLVVVQQDRRGQFTAVYQEQRARVEAS